METPSIILQPPLTEFLPPRPLPCCLCYIASKIRLYIKFTKFIGLARQIHRDYEILQIITKEHRYSVFNTSSCKCKYILVLDDSFWHERHQYLYFFCMVSSSGLAIFQGKFIYCVNLTLKRLILCIPNQCWVGVPAISSLTALFSQVDST